MKYGDLDMKEESSSRASEYGDVGDGSWEGRPRRMSIGGGVRLVRTISSVDGNKFCFLIRLFDRHYFLGIFLRLYHCEISHLFIYLFIFRRVTSNA